MPWTKKEDAPENLKSLDGAELTIEQINKIAEVADALGSGVESKWAVAISQFKKGHTIKSGVWVKKVEMESISYDGGKFEFDKSSKKYRKEVAKTGKYIGSDGKGGKVEANLTESFFDELVKNFDSTADIPVPLGHEGMKDPLKNTGFIRGLERIGQSLYAIFEITDSETQRKIDEGTIKHNSIGVVIRQGVGRVLEHICLTLKPAITGLKSFTPAEMFEKFDICFLQFEQPEEVQAENTKKGCVSMDEKEIQAMKAELEAAKEEKKKIELEKQEMEKKNAILLEEQIDFEVKSLVTAKKLKPSQVDFAKKLMKSGNREEVKALFEQNDSVIPEEGKTEMKRSKDGKGVKVFRASELDKKSKREMFELLDKSEKEEVVFVSDNDYAKFEQSMAKDETGRVEFADFATALNQLNTGSFFLPKLWESKIIRELEDGNYGFDAIAVPATAANGYSIAWNVVGSLSTKGTAATGVGTMTGSANVVISQVAITPARYGNSIQWTGEVNDWSVSNIANSFVYPLLLDDYRESMDAVALGVLTAASAVLDANTIAGGTYGRGTANLHAIGTFNDAGAMTTSNVIAARALLRANRAVKFPDNSYVCFAMPEQLYGIQTGTAWINAADYADSTRLISGEIGKYMGVRFVDSDSIAKTGGTWTAGAAGTGTAYKALMVGAQALGKGFDIPISIKYYDDDPLRADNGYFKRMQWNARGGYARLKVTEIVPIITTKPQILI
jgi:N4-gp56 family major capsid protein